MKTSLTSFHTKPRKELKRSPFKRKPATKTVKKRSKLPTIKSMRNKCDALLTPIVKKKFPVCLLCPNPTQVAHHHVHKSTSSILRYDLDNLINLCNHCHVVLHHNESYWASKIIEIMGLDWFKELEKKKNQMVKTDIHWYIEHHTRLKGILEDLSK